MTTSEGWHAEDIKAAVHKSGTTLGAIAIAAGYDSSAASHCLRQPRPAINQAIADHLGVPVHVLWPRWFDKNGELRPRDRESITVDSARIRQKRSAA